MMSPPTSILHSYRNSTFTHHTLHTGTLQHLSDVFLFRRKLFTLASWMATLKQRLSPNSLAGVIIVPSAGVGIVLGGYIIKKLKLGARESAKLAMICSGVSLLCFSTLFIVGCESINLGGINIPYTTG